MKMEKRIPIVLLSNDLVVGGAQRLVIDELELLNKDIFDLSLIVLSQLDNKGTFYALVPPGISVYKLNFRGFGDVGSWLRLIILLHQIRPRLVKSSLFFSNTVAWVLKPLFGYVSIASEHNTLIKKTSLQAFANRVGARVNYTMVVVSKKVGEYLAESEGMPRSAFTVIYNGVDLKAVQESKQRMKGQRTILRSTFGLGENSFVFLSVARITKQKNHHLMIESFAEALRARPDSQLLVVGDGELLDGVRAQVKALGIAEKVIFTGERQDVHTFYAISDAFVVTSRHEGFCIAAMEGLAFGMPLLSTRVAGIEEYLQDGVNGYFAEDTVNDLSAKMVLIQELIEKDPHYFKEACVETAKDYSKERYGKAYNALFLKALGGRRQSL